MKILWQAFDTVDYTGGPIVNAVRLLPELMRRGHEVLAVVEYLREHPNADKLKALGVECVTFSRPRYSEDHVRLFLEQIVRFKPDIFVSNISAHAGLAGHWAMKWGIPVVHTHRSDDALNNGMAEFFFTSDEKWRLSALVCVNRYLLNKIQALTSYPIRHRIIPSGVPLSGHCANQTVSRLKVAYAGRLVERQKRISEVVAAFISLARVEKDIDFAIIGQGDSGLVEQLKARVRAEGLAERISFIGRVHGEEYKKTLAGFQIIVLLSDYEGIPGGLMDGMSCGLIPVVHKMPGIDELVDHGVNGLIVSDRSENFIETMVRLKNHEGLRKDLSAAAVQTIADRFSLDRAANEWEDLFSELHQEWRARKSVPADPPRKIRLFREHPLLTEFRAKPGLRARLAARISGLAKAVQKTDKP